MKTKYLIIIVAVAVGIFSSTLAITYVSDYVKYSDENLYGISAKVVRSTHLLPIFCPIENKEEYCSNTHFRLIVKSETPAILERYKICNGSSCIEKDGLGYKTNVPSSVIPLYGIESWKIGDTVSIKVGASIAYDESYTHPYPVTNYIDLGQSVIGGTK